MADEQGTVGLIGLGQMGGAMCRTLLRGGWRVVAWDLARAAADAAAEAGAEGASDPAGVASRAQIIITSLPDVEAVRHAALSDRGIVRGDCAGRLLVDTSTVLAAGARALAADLEPHGVGFLDAPVSGGVRGAESGQLAIMVGGSVEHFERARAVLACLGKAVVHCGPVGAGQITKSCNQLVVMATHESIAETLVLAQACGLDPWRVREALLAGYGASPILEIQGPRMLEHDFAPGGKARFHLKDIAAISELAREAGLNLPVFSAAARQFERLVDAGGGDLDNSAVITVIEPHRGSAPTAGGAEMADLSRFDLTGRLALITGAGAGIGFALAGGLGRAGASLVLNDIDEPRLECAVGELRRQGLTVEGRVFDVRNPEQVEAGVAAVEETVGPIEILVNNAGIQHREALEDVSPESWREVIDTDLTGVFFVGQAVARRMIGRGHGKIINITSVFSEYSRPTIASYAAAKAGVKNLTRAMCAEWARYGIQANAIGPGYFVTPLTQRLRDDVSFDAWLRSRVPAGRWGELDDLVGAAVFLASRASDFVDGQTIHVDGGLLSVI